MNLDLESLRTYCRKKGKGVREEFPFDETSMVYKVSGKMFILISTDTHPLSINLKCDPERAIELREQYPAVTPGYHMNKRHWNTVTLDGSLPPEEVYGMIDHSFELVQGGSRETARPSFRKSRKGGR
ncbi:MAG TPA: MmcQ/YjbR family DNA-binding protein [Bacteroidota bacterium]|nr:MmcQ/YjbR family DNA-binding protein [Bacteroidota bacterium]